MRSEYYKWYVALVLAAAQAVSSLDRYIFSVVVEPIKNDLLISDAQLGLLSGTSFALVFCIASIPLGRLADISNRRLLIVAGICVWSMATVACGFATSFWGLFAARLGVGFGEAALLPAAVSLLAFYFKKEQMGRALAIFMAGNSIGRATAFLGGGLLLALMAVYGGLQLFGMREFAPWQGVFVAAGLLGFAIAGLCLTIKEPPRQVAGKTFRDMKPSAAFFWKKRGIYMPVFALYGLSVACAYALAAWMISLYTRSYGISVGSAALIVGITSLVAGPLGTIFGGWLTDRLIRARVQAAPVLVGAMALAFCPFGGLVLFLAESLELTVVVCTLIYLLMVAGSPACLTAVQLVTPDQHRGLISSLYLIGYSLIGFGLGALVVGLFSDFLFGRESIANSLALAWTVFALIGVPYALAKRRAYQAAVDELHPLSLPA